MSFEFSDILVLVLTQFLIYLCIQNDRNIRTAHRYLPCESTRDSSRGIPAVFVVRFMVLRNCSPRSMGRARPTWHQVAHLSRRVLAQDRAGPITSSIICHDYPEIIGVVDSLLATVYKRGCYSSLWDKSVILRRIKGMSRWSSLIAGRRITGNMTYCKGDRICLTFRRLITAGLTNNVIYLKCLKSLRNSRQFFIQKITVII